MGTVGDDQPHKHETGIFGGDQIIKFTGFLEKKHVETKLSVTSDGFLPF